MTDRVLTLGVWMTTGRPDLYARERAVRFTPGTVLMYALGTWHRGMPVWEGQARYHHHIGTPHDHC